MSALARIPAIRLAAESDVKSVCAIDLVSQQSETRRTFIRRSVEAGMCYLAVGGDGCPVGYAVLNYSFYEHGFVAMLPVRADLRRQGIGSQLMRHCESVCRTEKLFTSTNLSNLAMHSLLAKLGYALCGVIHELDEYDPELVYVKYLDERMLQERMRGTHHRIVEGEW